MDEQQLDVNSIAWKLNTKARAHPIGDLQTIRTELKGLRRRPVKDIFTSQTIHQDWACHHDGRSELQFNIGKEAGGTELRHGVAFSFETSQTLPSIDKLIPKVRLFNDYMQLNPESYADLRMWHFVGQGHERSFDYPPGPIMPELFKPGTFVFLGKRQPADRIDFETILNDFDRLLPLFEYVESGGSKEAENEFTNGFRFRAGFTDKASAATATLAERELNINLKHNSLQAALFHRLTSEYGSDNVGAEQVTTLGSKIDVVVRRSENEFWYYEIKTAFSPRACLREAFGQIMEYAYWPGAREAKRLIICGERPLDGDSERYLCELKQRFGLPIEYEQIIL